MERMLGEAPFMLGVVLAVSAIGLGFACVMYYEMAIDIYHCLRKRRK